VRPWANERNCRTGQRSAMRATGWSLRIRRRIQPRHGQPVRGRSGEVGIVEPASSCDVRKHDQKNPEGPHRARRRIPTAHMQRAV